MQDDDDTTVNNNSNSSNSDSQQQQHHDGDHDGNESCHDHDNCGDDDDHCHNDDHNDDHNADGGNDSSDSTSSDDSEHDDDDNNDAEQDGDSNDSDSDNDEEEKTPLGTPFSIAYAIWCAKQRAIGRSPSLLIAVLAEELGIDLRAISVNTSSTDDPTEIAIQWTLLKKLMAYRNTMHKVCYTSHTSLYHMLMPFCLYISRDMMLMSECVVMRSQRLVRTYHNAVIHVVFLIACLIIAAYARQY
jgi:hypothetical protein